jgi:hypothetical protein
MANSSWPLGSTPVFSDGENYRNMSIRLAA